jgi:hypothetical protein
LLKRSHSVPNSRRFQDGRVCLGYHESPELIVDIDQLKMPRRLSYGLPARSQPGRWLDELALR